MTIFTTESGMRQVHGRGGSAMIIALWTITLLSMLVMSFALDAMLEGRISTYVRQRRRVDYLTQSGVAIAEMLLVEFQNASAASAADDHDDRWRESKLRIKRGQTAVVEDSPDKDDPDSGVVRVEIIPETARWNINQLNSSAQTGIPYDLVWEAILTAAGVPQEYFEELIDCWNDWVDADSTSSGRYGAEDEYYRTLDPPYLPRNGPIDTVDELRLVKGFSGAILDGGVLNPEEKRVELQVVVRGIKDLFTTYGNSGKINVNAAPKEILMLIPEVDEITAGAIVEEREGRYAGVSSHGRRVSSGAADRRSGTSAGAAGTAAGAAGAAAGDSEDYSFKSVGDFISRIPGISSGVDRYVETQSTTFRVRIEGMAAGITHTIEAIAEVEGSKVRYLRWREDP